jgi:hypothetical protein
MGFEAKDENRGELMQMLTLHVEKMHSMEDYIARCNRKSSKSRQEVVRLPGSLI